MVEVNPPLSAASSSGPTPVRSAQQADAAFAEQWAKAQSAAGPASPTQLPSGDEDDNPLAPPPPPMPPGTTSAPAPLAPSSADIGSSSGAAAAEGSGAAALLTALGISPALSRIIKEARKFVPPGATLHVLSTEPGRFRARFAAGPMTAGPSPVVTLGSATPTATGIDLPTPPHHLCPRTLAAPTRPGRRLRRPSPQTRSRSTPCRCPMTRASRIRPCRPSPTPPSCHPAKAPSRPRTAWRSRGSCIGLLRLHACATRRWTSKPERLPRQPAARQSPAM